MLRRKPASAAQQLLLRDQATMWHICMRVFHADDTALMPWRQHLTAGLRSGIRRCRRAERCRHEATVLDHTSLASS